MKHATKATHLCFMSKHLDLSASFRWQRFASLSRLCSVGTIKPTADNEKPYVLVRCFPYFSPYNTTYHKVVTCWCAKIGSLARQSHRTYLNHHHHHHLSLNSEGRWGTTDDFETSFLHFPCSPLPSFTRRPLGLSFPRCVLPTSSGFETGSEQYLESDRDVDSNPPSSTYFWKDHDRRLKRPRRHCHGDQCREDQTDDKQLQRHQHRD